MNAFGETTVIEKKILKPNDHTENNFVKKFNILKIRKEKSKYYEDFW